MLVLGAAGGVGLSAVELAKAYGARVVAAVSTEEKAEVARKAGADETVIYPRAPFDKDTSQGTGRRVQGRGRAEWRGHRLRHRRRRLFRTGPALHRVGRPLSGGRLPRRYRQNAAQSDAAEKLRYPRRVLGRLHRARTGGATQQNIEELFDLWKAGKISPLISETYPARARARSHRQAGKPRRDRQARRDDGLLMRRSNKRVLRGALAGAPISMPRNRQLPREPTDDRLQRPRKRRRTQVHDGRGNAPSRSQPAATACSANGQLV